MTIPRTSPSHLLQETSAKGKGFPLLLPDLRLDVKGRLCYIHGETENHRKCKLARFISKVWKVHKLTFICSQDWILPHSPRAMSFVNREVICFGYSPTEYASFSLNTLATTELTAPVSPTTSGTGISNISMGAFSGLSGYMTLGLGAKAKPCVVSVNESEALVAKDSKWQHREGAIRNVNSSRQRYFCGH